VVSEGGVAHVDEGIVGRPREADGEVLRVVEVSDALVSRVVIRWPGIQKEFG